MNMRLEMNPAMSKARILNTTIPVDFEHIQAEETKRQNALKNLREWSWQMLRQPIHTQVRRECFTHHYFSQWQEAA